MPEISVVLPLYNTANLLGAVLDGFRQQTLPQSSFEIIAVDDGSTDDTPQILHNARTTLPLRSFRQRHAGSAAAKNLGLFAAHAPILLFADKDSVASRELLTTHLSAHRAHPEPQVAVLGQTRVAADVGKTPVMRYVTQVNGLLFPHYGTPSGPLSHAAFSAGVSCKREFLLNHAIFDSTLDAGYEYAELGYRLSGCQLFYEPAAISTFIRAFSFREFCERQEQSGRSERRFAELHPTAELIQGFQMNERLSLWSDRAQDFYRYMKWVEHIDEMAQSDAAGGQQLRVSDEAVLDDAYRSAFELCRAKGMAGCDGKHIRTWRSRFAQLGTLSTFRSALASRIRFGRYR